MREIVDYVIEGSPNCGELEKDVRELIKRGWQPHGPLIIQQTPSGSAWKMQAMVKYAPAEQDIGIPAEHPLNDILDGAEIEYLEEKAKKRPSANND